MAGRTGGEGAAEDGEMRRKEGREIEVKARD
jgi:hypothetical protein